MTTPYGIAVADGVSSTKFPSHHIARHLTTSFGQWIHGCRYPKQLQDRSNKQQSELEKLKEKLEKLKEESEELKRKSVEVLKELDETGEQSDEQQIDVEKMQEEFNKQQMEVEKTQEESNKQKMGHLKTDEELKAIKKETERVQNETKNLQEKIDHLNQQSDEVQQKMDRLYSKSSLCEIQGDKSNPETIKKVMRQIMINGLADLKVAEAKFKSSKSKDLGQSATFVSAYFSPEDPTKGKKAMLNVFQKGDSLALILRFDPVKRNWKPFVYTSDGQEKFNTPYQYIINLNLNNEAYSDEDKYTSFLSIEPQANDVVILGSDGLFDNLPISIIVMAFNAAVEKVVMDIELERTEASIISSRACLRKLLEAYQEIIKRVTTEKVLETDKLEPGVAEYDLSDFIKNWEEKKKEIEQRQQQNVNQLLQQDQKQNRIVQAPFVQDVGQNMEIEGQTLSQADIQEDSKPKKPAKCKARDLLYHKDIEGDKAEQGQEEQKRGFKGFLDPCFVDILDTMYYFDETRIEIFLKVYNPNVISSIITEMAKDMTNHTELYPSPFSAKEIRYNEITKIGNAIRLNQAKGLNRPIPRIPKRNPLRTKSDDITVVTALVFKKKDDNNVFISSEIEEKEIAYRLNLMEKRNKLELEQDVDYRYNSLK